MKRICSLLFTSAICFAYPTVAATITLEAENGVLGSEFSKGSYTDTTAKTGSYITIGSTVGGEAPGTTNRVSTYTVTFPAAGTYDLYARMVVGTTKQCDSEATSPYSDDSFYYGNGFGVKDATQDTDGSQWIKANNLASGGYFVDTEIVGDNIYGTAENLACKHGRWKWIKLSTWTDGSDAGITFVVPADSLTQTLQIAGREDGLFLDKISFVTHGTQMTVSQLDADIAISVPTGPALADGKNKTLGNTYGTNQIQYFNAYWNQVVPGNAGKWGSVEAVRDVMNWTELDAAYKLAKDNNFPFRFHVLIWGNQQPTWIASLPANEQLEEIKEWFAAVAERYPDLKLIEVVNEPVHDAPDGLGDNPADDGNYIQALGGNGTTGWDWVIKSFQLAREYFPNAKLMINEYSIENDNAALTSYKTIIQLLKDRNLIDAIGTQTHAFSTVNVSATNLKLFLDNLASFKLPIYVTEMDIDAPTEAAQLAEYQRIFPTFWEHPAVAGITLWGYRTGTWRETAYLIKNDGTERPAMTWLRTYVKSTNVPEVSFSSASSSSSSSAASSTASSTATSAASSSSKPASSSASSASSINPKPVVHGGGGSTDWLSLFSLLLVSGFTLCGKRKTGA